MKVICSIEEFRRERAATPGSLGLVPTMGYLHEGHLSLVRRARAENAVSAVWIFVNATQFNEAADFAHYPRDEARDCRMLEQERVDLLFMPPPQEIYPPGFGTYVTVEGVTERLEGEFRPEHFLGVATVVTKFFNIMQPTCAYFGQKDAQQVLVIKKMVADLNIPVEVVVCPTVREPDGLAMSSRNVNLSPRQRHAALALYRALCLAQEQWARGNKDGEAIRRAMTALIQGEPLARIDYVSVAHPETLQELDRIEGGALVSLAVHIGRTRLIDNVVL
ncbi:MAG: pantoate--beta-alanine ligase [Chloroflexi bacterium]|nr:pantoate--beta-alanine ligase [Chloroflexota bacterium]